MSSAKPPERRVGLTEEHYQRLRTIKRKSKGRYLAMTNVVRDILHEHFDKIDKEERKERTIDLPE